MCLITLSCTCCKYKQACESQFCMMSSASMWGFGHHALSLSLCNVTSLFGFNDLMNLRDKEWFLLLWMSTSYLHIIRGRNIGGSFVSIRDIAQDLHWEEQVPTVIAAAGKKLQQATDHLRHALTCQHALALSQVLTELKDEMERERKGTRSDHGLQPKTFCSSGPTHEKKNHCKYPGTSTCSSNIMMKIWLISARVIRTFAPSVATDSAPTD